ncbi:hypothetical protein CC78DRAFT_512515 [Lojkania enalia]|uniref:Uncharacterized protein n=1 Tax=Lojkania enalia TaxID=147567 RepID=A0A9P4KEJ7_9PLEO|nr:hypothetical protein CC78DRAFT_512515 [Didymosphaeria enalia]
MVVSFIAGLLFALGQHVLYKRLHHTTEDDEQRKVKLVLYGRALAYLSKVAFGGCVIICYRQRIWRALRDHAFSIWSIDQLFLATEDPSLFVNWETISKASTVVAMALVIWLIPLATIIFSPGALTFGDYLEVGSAVIAVPTLNFTAESYKNYRNATYNRKNVKQRSLIYVNTTDKAASAPGWFDYYDQYSADAERIALIMAYSLKEQSLSTEDARLSSCGGDFNCTYTISFIGPGYNCEELARGADDDQKLAEAGAPFDTSGLAPVGRLAYIADVDRGDYSRPQQEGLGLGGVPIDFISEDLGIFQTEPVLWIGYSIDSNETLPADSPYNETWKTRYDPHIFKCTHYETKYTVDFNYSGPYFNTHISFDFISPIINTTFSRFDNGSVNWEDIVPVENYISPRGDVPLYKKTAAYHAMGSCLRKFLRGKIELEPPIPGPGYPRVYSEVTKTRLVSNTTAMPKEDLPMLLRDFYTDMILSLFSDPKMLVVAEERVLVNTTRYRSSFIYDSGKLWACYGPVIFCVFVSLTVGAWTIWEDGTTFSVGFSRIMVTTRNSTLDHISRGACLGNDPFPPELMHTRLKFGVLVEYTEELDYTGQDGYQGLSHCTFGVPSELGPIVKGTIYAGLKDKQRMRIMKKEKID